MIGLIFLLVVGTYIAIWILVVRFSYRLTFRVTESKKKSFSIAAAFFLIMYLIPFWDLIPTLIMHKYYCNTQAGFWVYKTPEEWISENPDTATSLINYEKSIIESYGRYRQKYHFNEVFVEEISRSVKVFHAISRTDKLFKDKNKVLLKRTDFIFGSGMSSIHSGGSLEEWRRFFSFFWFQNRRCVIDYDQSEKEYLFNVNKFKSIGKNI
jgi:hypothetical protein